MRILWLGLILAVVSLVPLQAADISGKWMFSVDLDGGGHGDPTFVLKQESGKLTGTYDGPLGEREVSGTVTGDVAQFGFSVERDGEPVKLTYSAKIESPTKMSGTVKFEGAAEGVSGTWTAVRQESGRRGRRPRTPWVRPTSDPVCATQFILYIG